MRIPLALYLLLQIPTAVQAGVPQAEQTNDTVTVNLQTAVQTAVEESPEMAQHTAQRQHAEARMDEAESARFISDLKLTTAHTAAPGLTGSDNPEDALYLDPNLRNDWSNWQPFTQASIELTQPIYTWGQIRQTIRAASKGLAVEDAEQDAKRLEVIYRAARSYYDILLTEELYRLAENADEIVQRAKKEIKELLDEGAEDVDMADLYQVRMTEQEFKRRRAEITNRRRVAYSALHGQLFLAENKILRLDTTRLVALSASPDTLEVLTERALQNRPEIAQARAGVAAREAQVQAARANYYPKLFLGGSARAGYSPGRPRQPNPYIGGSLTGYSVRAGIGFRQNLDFQQTQTRIEQAEAQRKEVEAQLRGARQLIAFEVEEAYENLQTARAALNAQHDALTISREWLRTEQINFDLDLGNSENLVSAVRTNLEAKVAYYRAIHEFNLAVLKLWKATGTLEQRLMSSSFQAD